MGQFDPDHWQWPDTAAARRSREAASGGASSARGATLHAEQIDDPAHQAQLQPWVEMECYQLGHGRHVVEMQSLNLGSQIIMRERQGATIQKLGRAPADFCTLSVSSGGPGMRFSDRSSEDSDTVFFMPGNVEFDIHVTAGGETIYVGFNQDDFLRGVRALNPPLWDQPPQEVVPLATGSPRAFRALIDVWLDAARDARHRGEVLDKAVMRSQLLHSVLQIAADTREAPGPSHAERRRALQIGRAARDFVESHLTADTLPTVVDICMALGVSERTLQYAFREYIGLSPLAYLRAWRLNRVRAELAAADPLSTTITQVAMRFGFAHLGRFSGDYKRMFGVALSETLNA
jgi:AraC family ethanolamine operon transcriptional activator